jgi:hypothetical protein
MNAFAARYANALENVWLRRPVPKARRARAIPGPLFVAPSYLYPGKARLNLGAWWRTALRGWLLLPLLSPHRLRETSHFVKPLARRT